MKIYNILLIAILLSLTILGFLKYFVILQEKNALSRNLNQVREQAMSLELEKQNLLQAIKKEKESQKALTQKISELEYDLKVNVDKIAKLNTDFSVLQAENTALREENEQSAFMLISISQERDNLRAKLSSIAELKKAIKELKKYKQVRKVTTEVKEIAENRKIIEGNQGFLTKDGRPTYPAKVKIEVMPAYISK